MIRFDREPNGDRYYDRADPDFHEERKPRGCWCGLDGYPGRCPGPSNCPYSGYHDTDEEDEE
jgi:hypothetical protein